jgi:enoyl-[acyl-carrier-protein] reductase (NADH)
MKVVPPLVRLRSQISSDGRVAKFFLMFQGGQHSAFALPYNKMGLFAASIEGVIRVMSRRLAAHEQTSAAEICAGLTAALDVKAISVGEDRDTREKLLWIESSESGPFAFRMNQQAAQMLLEALADETEEPVSH